MPNTMKQLIRYSNRFKRDESGTQVIETALVLPLFLVIILGIMQWSWVFANHVMLDFGHRDAMRLVQSGSSVDIDAYKAEVCRRAAIINCDRLNVTVTTAENFGAIAAFNRNGVYPDGPFEAGQGGDIMVARAFYPVTVIGLSLLSLDPYIFATERDTLEHWAVSTQVFRNEYF